jgi:hypothetical protein
LNGVSAARLTLREPVCCDDFAKAGLAACAPSAAPTSGDSEVGAQIVVEPA